MAALPKALLVQLLDAVPLYNELTEESLARMLSPDYLGKNMTQKDAILNLLCDHSRGLRDFVVARAEATKRLLEAAVAARQAHEALLLAMPAGSGWRKMWDTDGLARIVEDLYRRARYMEPPPSPRRSLTR